jgi:hypothetical protein
MNRNIIGVRVIATARALAAIALAAICADMMVSKLRQPRAWVSL